ncbi:MAG: 30S ribosomal protein S5 alanine N-acetyltransferase [Hyphomicrobium sp.]|jgi:ribosomal-protein-alanine N-acetyltransferase|nr:30S ribosomal protein S5 alanine N-acetyltransferase [Hyphomicrobium sp.]PPD09496.1 MAG: 30S ribosomal protein S5 alanine N-acetyltransferase [Hyphomicrobium sp.]
MAFLRSSLISDVATTVRGERVVLRSPQLSDYGPWASMRAESRAHLQPWEPTWPRDDLTKAAFKRRVRHYQREARADQGYAFLVIDPADDRLVGGIALTNVQRGVTQSASVGYWLGRSELGRGYMADALKAMIGFSFQQLRLHRLEAATQPQNTPSIRVLERNGFEREGYARGYLRIDGQWRDHLLFGLVAPSETGGVA